MIRQRFEPNEHKSFLATSERKKASAAELLDREAKLSYASCLQKLNIHPLFERVFLNFSGYSLTVAQIQANATKRLHKFRNRFYFSRDAKRIYKKTYYSRVSPISSTTVTPGICRRLGRSLRWLDHVLRMPVDRLPQRALFAQPREGWNRVRGGQTMTWQRSMKAITSKLSCAGNCRLPEWGTRDGPDQWLETLSDMAQSRPQWRSSFSNPPLDNPLTLLDLRTNLSAPACNAQLSIPPPDRRSMLIHIHMRGPNILNIYLVQVVPYSTQLNSFSRSILSVPSCHANRRRHEG
ncbi:hypothetical protein T265_06531 [Opisthorchis viverrini]|uniref:Uncharacterized protein n=1 Tax=Opisthorchis viverrini TaxID=6198 RepID=A0A074ZKB1_OPIVI|nr:hypothetical protein T265_06531 [Opisthorchis viverrini]KER26177.1 hypothetical protein T265_06531 [Opisthorchis viverrini]